MTTSERDVLIAGVGMVPFVRPSAAKSYDLLGAGAISDALRDGGVCYDQIDQVYAGYVYGDSCAGNRAVYQVGMTGAPIFNVNNNCSTGSVALFLGRQAIASGAAECVMIVGFEQMNPGAIGAVFADRPSPFEAFENATDALVNIDLPLALRYFGGAGLSHMEKFGTTLNDFAKVRAKASRHAAKNPLAVFRNIMTEEEVMAAPVIWPGVMTRSMACPPTCGAAAAILVSRDYARRHNLTPQVQIRAQTMTTDTSATFDQGDMRYVVGYDMTQRAAEAVYETAGVGPSEIAVVELHDCFAHNELITYEGLGLCPEGGAQKFIADGDNTYGGRTVVNPSGGLLSKGHPLGATGLAQCYELVNQLRGSAAERQVGQLDHALQHNLGLGGACVVTLYQRL